MVVARARAWVRVRVRMKECFIFLSFFLWAKPTGCAWWIYSVRYESFPRGEGGECHGRGGDRAGWWWSVSRRGTACAFYIPVIRPRARGDRKEPGLADIDASVLVAGVLPVPVPECVDYKPQRGVEVSSSCALWTPPLDVSIHPSIEQLCVLPRYKM